MRMVRVCIKADKYCVMVLGPGESLRQIELSDAQAQDLKAQLNLLLPDLEVEPFSSDQLDEGAR